MFKSWIHAFRLRTLPLALSSIILGGFLSASDQKFSVLITILAIITTTLLQILSNLANDYGDYKAGTDNQNRVGPERTMQSGKITTFKMKVAIYLFVLLSLISGSALIYFGTEGIPLTNFFIFFGLGILAIAAAINYTMGKNPYGYKGYGDLFVLIFFGLVGVLGTYFLNTHQFRWEILLPAFSVGMLSIAVLNLNNMRDIENDKESEKITLVVKLGSKKAKIYHAMLIWTSLALAVIFVLLDFNSWYQFIFLMTIPLFIKDLISILDNQNPAELDPFLKKQAIHTLLFSITFGLGLIL
jgi:1,4-dihydroxy-2-naphthoate octaprenyltransferase